MGTQLKINRDKVEHWKEDVARSVDHYNQWFLKFAPDAYKQTRNKTATSVLDALEQSSYLRNITPVSLKENPSMLSILRMTTRPPLARDRLIGLAGVSPNLVKTMELKNLIPQRGILETLDNDLSKIAEILEKLADDDVFTWLSTDQEPTEEEKVRASVIVADRVCGTLADPIIRNAQEQRQLSLIGTWLEEKGYKRITKDAKLDTLTPGTYSFRMNVPVKIGDDERSINIPVDVAIQPKDATKDTILMEAKSAGDFTNTNKRRKEEAIKYAQIKSTYGDSMPFLLFLCGYFDSGYLGYEAAEGIDWIWEHRISDFELLEL
jgi:hypothetical protein